MTSSSNHIKYGQLLKSRAGGQSIAANDMVQIGGPGLKAYPVKCIDYAIKAAITTIVAQTSAAATTAAGYDRQAVVTDQFGNIYIASPASGGTVNKYGPNGGAALATLSNVTAASGGSFKMFLLSNGNIAVVSSVLATGVIWFAILDSALNQVKFATNAGTSFNNGSISYFDACPLTGAGFAIAYLNAAGTQMLLQTYDVAGTAVLAATNVQTFGGTPALVFTRLAQLSNGNLAVAFKSGTATPNATTFVVVTTAGVSVKANTVVDATNAGAAFVELSAISTGFFAIAAQNGTSQIISVFNNAGTLQGSKVSASNSRASTTKIQFKVVNDGTQFWLVHMDSTGTLTVTQITTAGAAGATGSVGSFNDVSIDAAVVGGILLVFCGEPSTAANSYHVFALPDAEQNIAAPYRIANATVGSAAATTGTFWPRVIFNGDFTGVFVYDQQNTAATLFSVIKFIASAIQGVSQTTNAAATGTGTFGAPNLISINPGPGMYPCNVMAGTNGVGFSHSSGSIPGINGKLFNYSVAMSGAGVPRPIN